MNIFSFSEEPDYDIEEAFSLSNNKISKGEEEDEKMEGSSPSGGYIENPGENDVLCGRGGLSNNNRANIRFRELIDSHRPKYIAASRQSKPKVSEYVVDLWKSQQPPGRFLSKVTPPGSSKKVWREVSDNMAKKKASQCLRARRVPRGGPGSSVGGDDSSTRSNPLETLRPKVPQSCIVRATMIPVASKSSVKSSNVQTGGSRKGDEDGSGRGNLGPLLPLDSMLHPLQQQQKEEIQRKGPAATKEQPTSWDLLLSSEMDAPSGTIPSTVQAESLKLFGADDDDDDFLFPQSSFSEFMATSSASVPMTPYTDSISNAIMNDKHSSSSIDESWLYHHTKGMESAAAAAGGHQCLGQQIPCAAAITENIFADEDW